MTRYTKTPSGNYSISGQTFKFLCGSRAQVWHGTAYKTSGGLIKSKLTMNKNDRIVSKSKQHTAKTERRLEKAGYFTKKGKFGFIKHDKHGKTARKGKGRGSRRMQGGMQPFSPTELSEL